MIDRVEPLDLHFQEQPHIIASYLLPHEDGAALVETGPGSTTPMLQARLADHGLTPNDITDVLVTHVHLDHAGAAGWMAQHGATIYVHQIGAPHLKSPKRLLASAERIYGDDMDRLWGEMLPVPEDQVVALEDEETFSIGNLDVLALDTPGHASHHMSYVIGDICFTGDVGGVRLPEETYVELPLAPPEIQLDHWRNSLHRLRSAVHKRNLNAIAPTHFGIYTDVTAHLDRLEATIESTDEWVSQAFPLTATDDDALRQVVTRWMRETAAANGVDEDTWASYELANPSWMAADGLKRYWDRYKKSAD